MDRRAVYSHGVKKTKKEKKCRFKIFRFILKNRNLKTLNSTGKFTALRPGIYFFSFTGLANYAASSRFIISSSIRSWSLFQQGINRIWYRMENGLSTKLIRPSLRLLESLHWDNEQDSVWCVKIKLLFRIAKLNPL
jgi:hypothetical protein